MKNMFLKSVLIAGLPLLSLSDEVMAGEMYVKNNIQMIDYMIVNNDNKSCTLTYDLTKKKLIKSTCVEAMGRRGNDLYCISEKEDTCRSSYEMDLMIRNEHG